MEKTANKKWSDELVEELMGIVGTSQPVQPNTITAAAEMLEVSERRVASKLRKMGIEVASLAKAKTSTFSEEESEALTEFLNTHDGEFTYKEVAENFADGKFTPKQIQGKVLALELTGNVKPTEKVVAASLYSQDEENIFIQMASSGAFIEDIAVSLKREINSIRGKALSLLQKGLITSIPVQRESNAKNKEDAITALGDAIHGMTVQEIAQATDKTERGIKTALTRRGIRVADYDGETKHAKALAKAAKAEAVPA